MQISKEPYIFGKGKHFSSNHQGFEGKVLLLSLGDDSLGDPNGIFYTVHIEIGMSSERPST